MRVNDNPGQDNPVTKGKVRELGPEGTIEEVEVDKNLDVCPDSPQEYIDQITSNVIDRMLRDDFDIDPAASGIKFIRINLPFVNTGGASLGANLVFGVMPRSNKLITVLGREQDISAGTVGIDSIDFSNGIDESFRKELQHVVGQLVNKVSKQLTYRANLRAGYNEFKAQQGLKEQSEDN